MKYLNIKALENVSEKEFVNASPYPWVNLDKSLIAKGFDDLLSSLPDVSMFEKSFNVERAYGQKSHDRYELMYADSLALSPSWKQFIEELSGASYRKGIGRLFNVKDFSLRFQWQYSFSGCSVSPHCDSRTKIGSHIFYFNTPDNWKEEWGGQTLVLDDEGKLDCDSAPELTAFKNKTAVKSIGNYSLLFARTDHSWHSVDVLNSPPGALRKIFTVVIEKKTTIGERIALRLKKLLSSAAR